MAGGKARRGHGHIRKLPSGRFQASIVGPDLSRHNAPSTFSTRMDAEGWISAEFRLIERGEWKSPQQRAAEAAEAEERERAASVSFREFALERWLPARIAAKGLSPRTVVDYRRYLDNVVLPTFGDVPVRDITPVMVENWVRSLNKDAPRRRFNVYSFFKSVMAGAVEAGLIDKSPAKMVVRKPPTDIAQPATAAELEAMAAAMPENLRLMVLLAGWCALRYGEVAALRRGDIDLDRGTIRVDEAVQWLDWQPTFTRPKANSSRFVVYPPHLRDDIVEHLARFTGPRAAALLFTTVYGNPYRPQHFYEHWYVARAAAGRPDLRFHDLRHTGATLAAASGATLAELMQRLGHKTASAALVYQHATQGSDARIAARLSEMAGYRAG